MSPYRRWYIPGTVENVSIDQTLITTGYTQRDATRQGRTGWVVEERKQRPAKSACLREESMAQDGVSRASAWLADHACKGFYCCHGGVGRGGRCAVLQHADQR